MYKVAIILFLKLLLNDALNPQDQRSLQSTFLEAEYFFLNEEYAEALTLYQSISGHLQDNANISHRIGVCYLNLPGNREQSVAYLEKAAANMSAKHREGTINQVAASYDALYDLARAYHVNYQFDKAKETYGRFMETLLPDDTENIEFIKHQINCCETAKRMMENPVAFVIEDPGRSINDDKDNFNPILADNRKSMAFMVSLKFYDAVMISNSEGKGWSMPVNITPDLQAEGDIFISCLSQNGTLLILSTDDNFNSDLASSSFNGKNWSKASRLNRNINTRYWESHGYISDDGNKLIFSSDRPGGYGGLDLYISEKINGDWGPAVNLGPVINTPFNEDRAFLLDNGKTIYFSSQGHLSMGGYDVFRATSEGPGKWNTPENLGYPVNNPDDNIFFMPETDKKSGYYSTYNEAGNKDILRIIFK